MKAVQKHWGWFGAFYCNDLPPVIAFHCVTTVVPPNWFVLFF